MHAFVPCPQFFCLLTPIASVCTKFPLRFLLMLMAIGPCAFNCMSEFISQSLHCFTQVDTQNLIQRMLFLCQCCFTSTRPWLFKMPLRDFQNELPTSYNKTSTAVNRCLPGLSGCPVSSLCWDPLFMPSVTFPSSNTFSLCFPEAPGFYPQ
jgi:hypothetical protein